MAKIMLVEDDNNLRQIYEDRLAAEGYEIVSAPDGEEALALAVKERPDLIIADVMMPKVSGFDMLDILRSTPETKDCKIIMMTALSQAEDKARAEKLGADRYLVKSQVTLEDVAKIAGEILNSIGATASATAPTTDPAASTAPAAAPAPTAAAIPVSAPPAPAEPVAATAPVATPAPAVTPPAEPAATPSVTSIPITVQGDDSADQAINEKKVEAALKEAAKLATPAAEEKAAAEKVDDFIASNPTLSDSAEPSVPAQPTTSADSSTPTTAPVPPPEPAPAPVVETPAPATVTIKVEDPASPTTSPAAPTPTPDPIPAPVTQPTVDDPSQKVADAVDGLLKEAEGTSTPAPEETTKNGYVADASVSTNGDSQSMVHTKRIEPITDGSVPQTPDINELLARETGEVAPAQPPVNSVITPGNAGSINADPVDNTPQVNVLAEEKPTETATTTGGTVSPTVTPAPGSDITL